jgi:serine/threonine-protein kinase
VKDERDRWSEFLSAPIDAVAAGVIGEAWIDRRFGNYEIVARLGAGGMGEVYRARDHRLGRDVAIKVLPTSFIADRDRLARIEREARVLAALNHPNIAAIFGVEDVDSASVLVLELVPGETLAHRLLRGPIPVGEAMPIARQIAEALEAAHAKGIIHRDVKPANIALTPDGVVKVLDFGLAKASDATAADASESPTLTLTAVQDGVRLGTAPYMSPEQTRGQAVDKRTDIWAFGCVLFEMLTGRVAFGGNTTSDFIAAILERDPDWSALPTPTPAAVRRLLRRCLEKDLKGRLPDIAVARLEIDEPSAPLPAPAPTHAFRRAKIGVSFLAMCIASVVLGVWLGSRMRSGRDAAPLERVTFELPLPPGDSWSGAHPMAISDDGQRIVYAARHQGRQQLYLRTLDRADSVPLSGTENAGFAFFSPDGLSVGFFADGMLKKMSLSGATPNALCPAPDPRGGAWGPDGYIVFAPQAGPLFRVSVNGGQPEPLTTLDPDGGEISHRWPQVLPRASGVLFTTLGPKNQLGLAVQAASARQHETIVRDATYGQYVAGHVVYVNHNGEAFATPFDLFKLAPTGRSLPLPERPAVGNPEGNAGLALAGNGTLTYLPKGGDTRLLTIVDPEGRATTVQAPPRAYNHPSVSPDGGRVAVDITAGTGHDVWTFDVANAVLTRATFDGSSESPIWTPDGKSLTFTSSRSGTAAVYVQPADGSGPPVQMLEMRGLLSVNSWSPDGQSLVIMQSHLNLDRLVVADRQRRLGPPLIRSDSSNWNGQVSPDGRWLAFVSDQSGQSEVYVTTFGSSGPVTQVSRDGGQAVLWSPSGRMLFYRRANAIIAVTVISGRSLLTESPKIVMTGDFLSGGEKVTRPDYGVFPDGSLLLLKRDVDSAGARSLSVVLNWSDELRELAKSK